MQRPVPTMLEPEDQPPPYSSVLNSGSYKYVPIPVPPYSELPEVHGHGGIFGNTNPAVQHSRITHLHPIYYNFLMDEEAIPDRRMMVFPSEGTNPAVSISKCLLVVTILSFGVFTAWYTMHLVIP